MMRGAQTHQRRGRERGRERERACMMQGDKGMAGGRENAMANIERRRRAKRAPTAGAISRASEVRACVVGWSDT